MTMTNSRICAQYLSQQYSLVAVGLHIALYTGPALHELRATSLITTSLIPLHDTDWLYCGQGRGGRNGRPMREGKINNHHVLTGQRIRDVDVFAVCEGFNHRKHSHKLVNLGLS